MCTSLFTEDKSHEYRSRRYEETAAIYHGVLRKKDEISEENKIN